MTHKVIAASIVWFIISCLAGVLGLTASLVPPAPQVILFALVVLLILAF